MLYANGITPTVLDHDAEQIEALRRFGWRVFYGDATRLDLLRTAGAASARVLVLAIDDVEQSLKVAALVREHFPQLAIVARARNVQHYFKLRELGVTLIERETLDSSLMSARSVLELLGWQPHHARTLAMRFRRHNDRAARADGAARGRRGALIAMAKQGRQQLEELFAQERAAQRAAQPARRRLAATQPTPRSEARSAQTVPQQLDAGEEHARVGQPVEPASAGCGASAARRATRPSAPAASARSAVPMLRRSIRPSQA